MRSTYGDYMESVWEVMILDDDTSKQTSISDALSSPLCLSRYESSFCVHV